MPLEPITPAVFPTLIDNGATTLSAAYAPSGGTFAVINGSIFGSPSSDAPMRLTVIRASDSTRSHYKLTGVSGNILTVVVMDGYSDIALAIGDTVGCWASAETFDDIFTAIATDEAAINATIGQVNSNTTTLAGLGSVYAPITGSANYLAPNGVGSGLTGITATQVGADASGAASAVQSASAQRANNLSDLANASAARANLQLGSAAVLAAGSANGAATLDSTGHVPSSQIPSAIVNGLEFAGLWNASTNTPTLTSSTGTTGAIYKVSTTGTTTLNGISQWNAGDELFFDGSTWDKIDGLASEVISVAGRTGNVVLATSDVSGLGTAALQPTSAFQIPITLTTTGSSGAATFNSGTLNIPNYAGASIASTTAVLKGNGSGNAVEATAGTDYVAPGIATAFTAQQNFGSQSLTYGSSITWNLATQQVASVTLTGNATLANPSNMVNGGTYILTITQDGTGSRTLAYGTDYLWPGGVSPTLTTTPGAVDVLTFVSNGSVMRGAISQGYSA
jgi:hypothetical protein